MRVKKHRCGTSHFKSRSWLAVTHPDCCATTLSMVANAQARAAQRLAATAVAPNAQHVFALLVAENHEVQNALVHFTAGAKLDSIVQKLLNRLGRDGSGA
jgi:hypothetical protein